MEKKYLWLSIAAVILSFVGGFLLANTINRSELVALRGEAERIKNSPSSQSTSSDLALTNEEINQKLVEAEQKSGDFNFQRNLGLALYRYAAMKQDPDLVDKAIPLLERANRLNPSDYDAMVGLGNALFDRGYLRKDNAAFESSRQIYIKALEQKPTDKDVRTDLGLTYFLQQPPDYPAAIKTFKQNLDADPKHERSLQFLVQALSKNGQNEEASRYYAALRAIDPANPTLQEFSALSGATNTQ
ncbi:MAG TPA: tetratricopeptide repeat protein [Pyrinomonadaceae bacterium]|nr:tetratricopeptide repeat protein [Pyrinomonadaceae bacterium]